MRLKILAKKENYSKLTKMDILQIILLEEGEFNNHNYFLMKSAQEYKHTFRTDENSDLFLTVNSLITLNNMITDSRNITLRNIHVTPAEIF